MKRRLFFLSVPICLVLSACASLEYPLPSCDGFSRRPLNRSMWDWSSMSPPAPAPAQTSSAGATPAS